MLQIYRVQVSHFCFFLCVCVSLLVSLEMQVQEGPNLVHMYRHHCLLCICNKISLSLKLSVYFRCIVYAFLSYVIINFLRIRISTVVVLKVYNPQRTFDLDQSLWPTTFQNLGMRQVPLKLPQGKKFALFPVNSISSGHNSPKYRT